MGNWKIVNYTVYKLLAKVKLLMNDHLNMDLKD